MRPPALPGMAGLLLISLAGSCWAGSADADPEQLERGKTLFMSEAVPACSVCHALSDAGAEGTIGPDLDELKPDAERIKKALQEGIGVMPSFADSLDDESMDAITAYILHATGAQ
jgi:cytochrome c6